MSDAGALDGETALPGTISSAWMTAVSDAGALDGETALPGTISSAWITAVSDAGALDGETALPGTISLVWITAMLEISVLKVSGMAALPGTISEAETGTCCCTELTGSSLSCPAAASVVAVSSAGKFSVMAASDAICSEDFKLMATVFSVSIAVSASGASSSISANSGTNIE